MGGLKDKFLALEKEAVEKQGKARKGP
jgi:hypothetical protein